MPSPSIIAGPEGLSAEPTGVVRATGIESNGGADEDIAIDTPAMSAAVIGTSSTRLPVCCRAPAR